MILSETPKSNHTTMARKGWSTLLFSSSKTLSSFNSFPSSSFPSSPAVHKFTESMMEENIENAESIIRKWDPDSAAVTHVTSLFHQRKEAKEFLKSVKDLRLAMHFLVSEHSASDKLVLAQNLMQIAMKRLEKELYQILSAHRDQLDPESLSGLSSDGSSNFEDDDEIGSEEEIKIAGESITKVEREATNAMSDLSKDCSENLFGGEKALCDHVFSASQTIRESCFTDITKEGATNLFRFPELIAKCKKTPERIFLLMELHEALSNLWPEIELTFNSESTSEIKSQAFSSLQRLGESVRAILFDFESTIQKDSSKTTVLGGGIHPLTRKVINFLSVLSDYGGILSEIFADSSPPLPESYFESPTLMMVQPQQSQSSWLGSF
ncbi:hypothetical protein GH714_009602 [Hevea brasiliensis]|uniref:Exocyst subunit Exo70 family protein n=1 Tax=Hevea brasiliensis TaxID=3981 RepID=A0A6A6MZV3_HEVBR|nr:hypothetical protein GH714_009602 [Hevea brasiliensis]